MSKLTLFLLGDGGYLHREDGRGGVGAAAERDGGGVLVGDAVTDGGVGLIGDEGGDGGEDAGSGGGYLSW